MTQVKIDGKNVTDVYEEMKTRNVKDTTVPLTNAHVAIGGAGGLGSNIAIALARAGVGHLTLIDFDVVELSNLNRQQYKLSQVGVPKVVALKQNILEFNPFIEIKIVQTRVTAENVATLFGDCDVICEAFDNPSSKALILQQAREQLANTPIVMGNGMAGVHSTNLIKTVNQRDNIYICGDGTSMGSEGLVAPRVLVCAGHQANMILQLLFDKVTL